MAVISQRIKELREARGISQQTLADIVGKSKSSINMYERGEREPGIDTMNALINYFDVDMNYLTGNSDVPNSTTNEAVNKYSNILPIEIRKIPMLGEIACGEPIFANEDREYYVEAGTDIQADFCLKARGDSMTGARIMDGDIVFLRQQPMVENGEIAAVIINDEATLKRVFYYRDDGKLVLQAENPKYAPLVYVGDELNQIKILGKAVAFQSDVQ